jgi:hypothetical protein
VAHHDTQLVSQICHLRSLEVLGAPVRKSHRQNALLPAGCAGDPRIVSLALRRIPLYRQSDAPVRGAQNSNVRRLGADSVALRMSGMDRGTLLQMFLFNLWLSGLII